jgi:protein involved in polysaccharide export with SLBB domain
MSFLQVHDLLVTGLTVDELRAAFDEQLSQYFPARTIVIPTAYNSKKYFLLGKVVNEGVFTLDRPLTIIEAVARAKGFETGTFDSGTAETADLGRAILVRGGKRVPLDFERLFRGGDLSQNIALEPGDYLYFPGATGQVIYVLGEVLTPGAAGAALDASVLTVISTRGGFTERAYQKRILIVRGSLQRPQAYVVDVAPMLAGRSPAFKLHPGDIVYVNARPWIKAEELLDIAIQSFIEAAITAWAGSNVGPFFTSPVAPQL